MGAIWTWTSRELRRRWGATVALALLVGFSGAVVLTAAAGARRTDSAFERLLEQARSPDVRLQYSSAAAVDDRVLAALRAHPAVEAAHPIYFTLAASPDSSYDLAILAGPEREVFESIDRPRVLEGRLPNPEAANEVALNRFAAGELGVGVGDALALATFTPEQLEGETFGEPAGPRLELEVVGLASLPEDVADGEFAGIFATPAFHEATWGRAAGFGPSVDVLVRAGADASEVVRQALAGIEIDEIEMTKSDTIAAQVADGTRTMAWGLITFAAAAALAAVVASAQALQRRLMETAEDHPALLALGMTRAQRTLGTALVALPPVVAGAVLAASLSVVASPLMPLGTARRAEPDPGVAVDVPVLTIGGSAMVLTLLAVAAAGAAFAARAPGPDARACEPRAPGPDVAERFVGAGPPRAHDGRRPELCRRGRASAVRHHRRGAGRGRRRRRPHLRCQPPSAGRRAVTLRVGVDPGARPRRRDL